MVTNFNRIKGVNAERSLMQNINKSISLESKKEGEGDEAAENSKRLRHGQASHIGARESMEDYCLALSELSKNYFDNTNYENFRGFFIICDGHGGHDAAYYTSQNLFKFLFLNSKFKEDIKLALSSAFLETDLNLNEEIKAGRLKDSGTTALVLLAMNKKLYIANAGDCRGLLSVNGKAIKLTKDHRPIFEKNRIEEAGGIVDRDGYLNGDLALSRAIGDFHFKDMKRGQSQGPLIADPELHELELSASHEFLILASDGVTEVLTNQTIIDIARDSLRASNCPQKSSQAIVDKALMTGASDNIMVMTVYLREEALPQRQRGKYGSSRLKINKNSPGFENLVSTLKEI